MKKRIVIAGTVVLAAVVYWAIAQPAAQPLAAVFPTGALLYLEAKDFSSLIGDWDGSAEKAAWLKSANHDVFSQSALYQKLGQAQSDFATAAGIPTDYALLKSVAGTNSALAIYNVGALQFLYATHLPSGRALNTALWKARGSYQTRKAGGVDFYVKEDAPTKRVAAFAYAGDLLLLATREDLIAGALELLASTGRPSLRSEDWFANALQSAGAGTADLRLVHNVARLEQTPHFRSHWVQGNAAALREFSAGVADLERATGEVRERRILLRVNASAAISDESATGQLLAAVPDTAGFYRATLKPEAAQVDRAIEEKIFSATLPAKPLNDFAPPVEPEHEQGSEQDLETRIDEAALSDDRVSTAFSALRERLASTPVAAMLEVGSTRVDADQVFVGSQSAIVLLAASNWDGNAMRGAIASAAGSLWSSGGSGVGWKTSSIVGSRGAQELDGLGRIAVAVDGRWLVIGNSAELVNAIFASRTRPAVAGSTYAGGWRHARELPNFERMMRLIDFPQSRAAGDPAALAGREPMFYSENIASFGRVLNRVQSAVINVHDAGSTLRESVIYRLMP